MGDQDSGVVKHTSIIKTLLCPCPFFFSFRWPFLILSDEIPSLLCRSHFVVYRFEVPLGLLANFTHCPGALMLPGATALRVHSP